MSAFFWDITQRMIIHYRRFGTTNWFHLLRFLYSGSETGRLSRNVGKELQLYAAIMQFPSLSSNKIPEYSVEDDN